MDHVNDINEGPCAAHCVGILSMLLLQSVCGVFLINAALVHAQWPQITVLVRIMVLTVLAILLVGLCDRYIGVKIVVAIPQLLPCAVLFTTARHHRVCRIRCEDRRISWWLGKGDQQALQGAPGEDHDDYGLRYKEAGIQAMESEVALVIIKAFVPRRRQTACTKYLPVRGLCCAFVGGPRLSLVRPGVWF